MKRIVSIGFLVAAMATASCGSDKDKGKKPGGKADEPSGGAAAKTTGTPAPAAGATAGAKKELPPPPKEAYQGKGRIVNLYLDDSGKTQTLDVWAKRSINAGPVQLAEGIELGKASDWFGVPKGQSVAAVAAGAGPDGEKLGGIFGPKEGEHITGILIWEKRGPSTGSHWETAPKERSGMPKPPPAGKGLVVIRAGQLRAHEEGLKEAYGGSAFLVGDGAGTCVHQRVEDEGFQAAVLGGTNPTVHDLPPGKAKFTLHKWLDADKCGSPAVHEFEVDVQDGKGTLVLVYTPDGKKLEVAQLPMAVGAAN